MVASLFQTTDSNLHNHFSKVSSILRLGHDLVQALDDVEGSAETSLAIYLVDKQLENVKILQRVLKRLQAARAGAGVLTLPPSAGD